MSAARSSRTAAADGELRNEYDVARSREQSLTNSIDKLAGKNSDANRSLVHLRELEQKATALKGLYESFIKPL